MTMLMRKIKEGRSANATAFSLINYGNFYLLNANATFTAQATVQPTIGLFTIQRNPIIST